jgi:hypothetical protein
MAGSIRHGTYKAYAEARCRCYRCVAYQRERVARNRAERLASGRLNHGTRSARDCGCQCEPCLATRPAKTRRRPVAAGVA